jgi:hypothetical protein
VALESLTFKQLLRQIVADGSHLARKELELARIESRRDFARQGTRLLLIGAIGLCGCAALLLLCAAGVAALGAALGDRYWAGALIIGGALALLAALTAVGVWVQGRPKPLGHTRRELRAIKQELTWANPTTAAP